MSLNIHRLIKKKREALPKDSDYIEELERMLEVTDEAYNNIEEENKDLQSRIAELESKAK
jgi:predicted  nucleic acid-binding Zn-ribbon protein